MMTEADIVRNWKNRAHPDKTQLKILHDLTCRKMSNLVEILQRNGCEVDPNLGKDKRRSADTYSPMQWCEAIEDILNGYTLPQTAKRNDMNYNTLKGCWKRRAILYGYDPKKKMHRRG